MSALELPRLRVLARHALPRLIEGTIVPLALFYGALALVGVWGALLIALAWCYCALGWRFLRGHRIPGLLAIGALGLTARTVIAFASGSIFMYFLQPTLTTLAVGAAFLVSVPAGRPLAERLAVDFFPLPEHLLAQPTIRRVFVRITLLWALVNVVNAAATVWLLVTQPIGVYLLGKTVVSMGVMAAAITLSTVWFRRTLRRLTPATVPVS